MMEGGSGRNDDICQVEQEARHGDAEGGDGDRRGQVFNALLFQCRKGFFCTFNMQAHGRNGV